jgi:molybdopterin-guanine dinucleotide biosynthesis protein A
MSNKKDQANRFEGLMGSLGKASAPATNEAEPTLEQSQSAPVAKSKSKDYQRTTVYLPKALHRKLKAAAANEDREISDIIEELVSKYLDA